MRRWLPLSQRFGNPRTIATKGSLPLPFSSAYQKFASAESGGQKDLQICRSNWPWCWLQSGTLLNCAISLSLLRKLKSCLAQPISILMGSISPGSDLEALAPQNSPLRNPFSAIPLPDDHEPEQNPKTLRKTGQRPTKDQRRKW